jgi:TPR repeat protein
MRITVFGCLSAVMMYAAVAEPANAQDSAAAAAARMSGAAGSAHDLSPGEALRAGTRFYYAGEKERALDSLRFAAENGHPLAAWKLGRMYSRGDGVKEDDIKAFEYFREIASNYADDSPSSPRAPFIASAFVELGSYYLTGISDSAIKPNVARAREIFSYAASYFGDADAQFHLGMLYLDDSGRDVRMAARWLKLAAKKGHLKAQARLGELLYTGDFHGFDNKVAGLMWLTVAQRRASGSEASWITELQERSFSLAEESVRRRSASLAESWMQSNPAIIADSRQ